VQVSAQNGVVALSGSVALYADKLEAQKNVGKVKNVVSVVNDIQVPAGETSDQQLADKIGKQLAYDRVGYGNAFNAITVSVNSGVVTLGGHALGPVAKESALNIAKRTLGVQNVIDKIEVDPVSPMDDQLRVRVARTVYGYPSLNKYAINPANPIRITVINGHVILSGVVDSEADKNVAGIQANTVPGVFSVTNNLQVAGQEQEKRQ
jgi:hyperosmotically inducible protein